MNSCSDSSLKSILYLIAGYQINRGVLKGKIKSRTIREITPYINNKKSANNISNHY